MPKAPKPPKPIELRPPDPNPNIDNWLVLGLDPSIRRTGFAVMGVFRGADGVVQHQWLNIGSAKPDDIKDGRHMRTTLWARSKAISMFLRELLRLYPVSGRTGLMISMEYPPPGRNDYLVGLNRVLHVVLFEDSALVDSFGDIRVLTPNPATLRALMGLTQRGAANKKENIEKAYTFVDRAAYPQLDTDSCDAVLMAKMGEYAATMLMGRPDDVPRNFLVRMTNTAVKVTVSKKTGRSKEKIEGILHHPEYWYAYQRQSYGIGVKDATSPKKTLSHKYFTI